MNIASYDDIRREIVRKINLHQISSKIKNPNAMDVDELAEEAEYYDMLAVMKGKGKGGGNSGGNSNGGKGG